MTYVHACQYNPGQHHQCCRQREHHPPEGGSIINPQAGQEEEQDYEQVEVCSKSPTTSNSSSSDQSRGLSEHQQCFDHCIPYYSLHRVTTHATGDRGGDNKSAMGGQDDKRTNRIVTSWTSAVAAVDAALFVISVGLVLVTERYVCYDGPLNLDFSALTMSSLTGLEEEDSRRTTILLYLKNTLKSVMVDSPLSYHLLVIGLFAALMIYLVTEIWLLCLLVHVGRTRRVGDCIRWLVWRSVILGATVVVCVYDVANSHMAGCGNVILVVVQIIRTGIGGVPVLWVLCGGYSKTAVINAL